MMLDEIIKYVKSLQSQVEVSGNTEKIKKFILVLPSSFSFHLHPKVIK